MTYRYQYGKNKPFWMILLAIASLFESLNMMGTSTFQLDSSFWLGIIYFILAIGALIVAYALFTPTEWGWWFSILTYGVIYAFEAIVFYSYSDRFDLAENDFIDIWFYSLTYNILIWCICSMYVLSNKPYFTGKIEVAGHDKLFEAEKEYKKQAELEELQRLNQLHKTDENTKKIVIE